jgi:hypothetical protein
MQTPDETAQAIIDAFDAHDVIALIATFSLAATWAAGRAHPDGPTRFDAGLLHAAVRGAAHGALRSKRRTIMDPFVLELQEISGDDQPGMQAMLISEVCEGQIAKVW